MFRFVFVYNVFWVELQPYCCCCSALVDMAAAAAAEFVRGNAAGDAAAAG